MDHEQALPEGIRKPFISDMTCAVKMGASMRHFEVWHRGQSSTPVLAIWRNEVGPARSAQPQAMP